MKPPFIGTRIVENVSLEEVAKLLNREALFASRWQFRKNLTTEEWERFKIERVLPVYERLILLCESKKIIEPRIVYGHFECRKQENALLVSSPGPAEKVHRFEFPRQRQSPNLCISDFFPDGFLTMQLVTIGDKIAEEGSRLFKENRYSDVFYLKGLAAELAEATAEHSNRIIREELGVAEHAGARFSFGYPAAPELLDQKKLYALLGGGRIGVKLTETCQLIPEHSTSAIVSVSPEAKHFHP